MAITSSVRSRAQLLLLRSIWRKITVTAAKVPFEKLATYNRHPDYPGKVLAVMERIDSVQA